MMSIMLHAVLGVALLASADRVAEITDDCGQVEINTVLDEHGRERFTQLIYRDHYGRIRDWRMLRSDDMIPQRGLAIWLDGQVLRVVTCRMVIRTVTSHDPEVEDRAENPPHKRRKLRPPAGQ